MAKFSGSAFIRSQLKRLPPVLAVDLAGKTVVVVGANVGLGFETAKHFAGMNPERLILTCRSQAKGDAAAADIKRDTGYMRCEVRIVDLGQFGSVSSFATKFEAEVGRLDVLVCNAGVLQRQYERSKDGWESTLQVNNLASPLLSLLLLPTMLKTARTHGTTARLVIVSADMHYMADIPEKVRATPRILDTLSNEEYCKSNGAMGARYAVSKLLNVLYARALTAHLAPTAPLIVTAVGPGFCHSTIRRHIAFPASVAARIMEALLARPTEQGARVIVFAALGTSSPGGRGADGLRGRYVSDCAVKEESDWIFTEEGAESERRVWSETIEILSKADPRVRQIADEHLQETAG